MLQKKLISIEKVVSEWVKQYFVNRFSKSQANRAHTLRVKRWLLNLLKVHMDLVASLQTQIKWDNIRRPFSIRQYHNSSLLYTKNSSWLSMIMYQKVANHQVKICWRSTPITRLLDWSSHYSHKVRSQRNSHQKFTTRISVPRKYPWKTMYFPYKMQMFPRTRTPISHI